MNNLEKRKEEVERKRQHLAQLRAQRQERQQRLQSSGCMNGLGGGGNSKAQVDELVDQLLSGHQWSGGAGAGAGAGAGGMVGDTSTTTTTTTTNTDTTATTDTTVAQSNFHHEILNKNSFENQHGTGMDEEHHYPRGYKPTLTLSSPDLVLLEIEPKVPILYEKMVQTTSTTTDTTDSLDLKLLANATQIYSVLKEEEEGEEVVKDNVQDEETTAATLPLLKELSDQERSTICASELFQDFVSHSTKLMERALKTEPYDILIDYAHDADLLQQQRRDADSDSGLKLESTLFSNTLTKNRTVTSLDWSTKHPELLLTSYNNNPVASSVNDSDGLVVVWNTKMSDSPEFIFYSQSDVTVAKFSPFHPNYIIGGTYSGQILLWDTRVKRYPILKSPLSAAGGHTHPVYALDLVGTQNAHVLVSASNDGVVCTWQLDMLARPMEILELVHPSHPKTEEIAVTSISFAPNDMASFLAGTEEGGIYLVNRNDRAGSKAGINLSDSYKSHSSMITSLAHHPNNNGPIDFSHLFLSSSVDWTVKLWKSSHAVGSAAGNTTSSSTPVTTLQASSNTNTSSGISNNTNNASRGGGEKSVLFSFEEAHDYIYDTKWSPTHPAVFGYVDGSGKFDFYNLNIESEIPLFSVSPTAGKALSRMAWSQDGKRVALGSSDGLTYVYDCRNHTDVGPNDFSSFQRVLQEMAAAQS